MKLFRLGLLGLISIFAVSCIGTDSEKYAKTEESYTACKDGKDNDGDGNWDCYDHKCRRFSESMQDPTGLADSLINAPDFLARDLQPILDSRVVPQFCRVQDFLADKQNTVSSSSAPISSSSVVPSSSSVSSSSQASSSSSTPIIVSSASKISPNSLVEFNFTRLNDAYLNASNQIVLAGGIGHKGYVVVLHPDGTVLEQESTELANDQLMFLNINPSINNPYISAGRVIRDGGDYFGGYGDIVTDGKLATVFSVINGINRSVYEDAIALNANVNCVALNQYTASNTILSGYMVLWRSADTLSPHGSFVNSPGTEMKALVQDGGGACLGIGWKSIGGGASSLVMQRIAQDGTHLLQGRSITLSGGSNATAHGLVILPNDNLAALVSFGSGFAIAILQPDATVVSETTEAGPADITPTRLLLASDGGYLVSGETPRGGVVVKTDNNGVVEWTTEITDVERITGIVEASDGSIYASGWSTINNEWHSFVFKLSAAGVLNP
jgi:hypothetical protein